MRYFTGAPCVHGHVSERFAKNGHCVVCGLKRSNERYALHGERLRAQRLARYYADPQEHNRRVAEWSKQNKDKIAQIQKRWRERNPDKRCSWEHRRLARKANAKGSYTAEDIAAILVAQRHRCNGPNCGVDILISYTIDHIIPLSRGGSNWPTNLQLLCQPCNSSKSDRTMDEWISEIPVPRAKHRRAALDSSPTPQLAGALPPD